MALVYLESNCVFALEAMVKIFAHCPEFWQYWVRGAATTNILTTASTGTTLTTSTSSALTASSALTTTQIGDEGSWNSFDFTVVFVSSLSYIIPDVFGSMGGVTVVLRILRLLRLLSVMQQVSPRHARVGLV